MGAKGSKNNNLYSLTKDETDAIDKLMSYKECISLEDLMVKWNTYLSHNMSIHLKHLISTNKPCRQRIVHIYLCLSTSDIHQESYQKLISSVISKSNVKSYMTDLIETIFLCLKDTDEYAYWIRIGAKFHTTLQLSTQLSKDLSNDINTWLENNIFLKLLHRALISTLYCVPNKLDLLPHIDINQKYIQSFKTILDFGWIMYLKHNLPVECQESWRLLFSSTSHGESFQSLSTSIVDQGNTIIILRDSCGNVFGGYASQPWLLKPKFYGDSSCFLFSLSPNLNLCSAAGHNDNFMYMNSGQHTLPNGIGMGGQMDYWGLWIDSEYGIGQCNVTCSTYCNYSMLSGDKEFQIDALEVWCVKEKPKQDSDEEERKIPSGKDNWDLKLLEMAGRPKYSDGYREENENE